MQTLELMRRVMATIDYPFCKGEPPPSWIGPVFNDREKCILQSCVLDGVTMAEMGRRMKLSTSRVSQIRNKALRRIKHPYSVFWVESH